MNKPISEMTHAELVQRLIELRAEMTEIVTRIDKMRYPQMLTSSQRVSIGASYVTGEKVSVLASEYRVDVSTIRRIVRRLGLPARFSHRPLLAGNGAC